MADRAEVFERLEHEMGRQMVEQATALDNVSSLESPPELRKRGLDHLLAAPLVIEGRRLGALLLLRGERDFTAVEVDLMKAAVSQADSAVMHARTYERLHRRTRELEVIYQVDRIRDVTVEPHNMLSAIINVVVEELEADLGLVSLVDEETEAVELKAVDDRVGGFRRLERAVVQRLMEQATALGGVSFLESFPELQAQGLPYMNLASRICGVARGGQVLISRATYQLIRQDVVGHELAPVQVKGKVQPVQLYEVVSLPFALR